jgi:short-subunit dehydrogenase
VLETSQIFAPMLVETNCKVLNIGSIAQFAPFQFAGVYSCSKAVLGTLSDTLR